MSEKIRFVLNDKEVVTNASPGTLVLDFVRSRRRLTGTKEGCREGDCGACVVLVGNLDGHSVRYKPVTSCLMPVGELQGKHLVTIEGLNMDDLTCVQQAIVDEGASQCGFCTPGIVVSLTSYLICRHQEIDSDGVKNALGGHLCRCTGYRSLKAGTDHFQKTIGSTKGVQGLVGVGQLPRYFGDIPDQLRSIGSAESATTDATHDRASDFFVAGGTDLYVQRGDELRDASVLLLNGRDEMKRVSSSASHVDVGALCTFEDFGRDRGVREIVPDIMKYLHLIASLQIRNRATVGGNIINASPIADLTILLLALGAELAFSGEGDQRTVPLDQFYLGYKKMDLRPGEVLTTIRIPRPRTGSRINWEKVSKRKCLDIASVNSAIRIRLEEKTVTDASIAVGGVAPIPLSMKNTASIVKGKSLNADLVAQVLDSAQCEIAPISDIRGSAVYKRLLVRQLLIAHFVRLFPNQLSVQDFL